MGFVAIIIAFILIFVFVKSRTNVDVPSFLQPTLPLALGTFGVYCFTGKQGSGKTYSVNKFIRKHAKGKKIYSNLTFEDLEYTKLESMEQMLALKDKRDCYIIYDEIFTWMTKSTRISDDIQEFLSQQRKQNNIFITTAQEWLNIPIEFRRFVRIQIDCKTRPLGKLGGIIIEKYYDAYNMAWDNLANEYVAPLITNKISKYERRFMITYDTNERIRKLK